VSFRSDFYSVAAQVIAVLFVVLAVEYRVLIPSDDGDEDTEPIALRLQARVLVLVLGLIATTAIGVAASLVSLYDQSATTVRDIEIIGTLIAEGVMVAAFPISVALLPFSLDRIDKFVAIAEQMKEGADAVLALDPSTDPGPKAAAKIEAGGIALRQATRAEFRAKALNSVGSGTLWLMWPACFAVPVYALGAVVVSIV
jgi:hypothetical protein